MAEQLRFENSSAISEKSVDAYWVKNMFSV